MQRGRAAVGMRWRGENPGGMWKIPHLVLGHVRQRRAPTRIARKSLRCHEFQCSPAISHIPKEKRYRKVLQQTIPPFGGMQCRDPIVIRHHFAQGQVR